MYESEANGRVESAGQIPNEVLARFRELTGAVTARTVLPWSEHCTECVWPTCYKTCDLYAPREDLKCRRFEGGMIRLDDEQTPAGYIIKISFKRWGKLWTKANTRLYPVATAARLERQNQLIGSIIFRTPMPPLARKFVTGRRYNYKRRKAMKPTIAAERPDSFVVECYNPQNFPVELSLTMLPHAASSVRMQFQRLIESPPGFYRERIPIAEISQIINFGEPFEISLIPNEIKDGTTMFFGLLDFVRDPSFRPVERGSKVKCVVWDLDNTLWDGVLVEDGADGLQLRPGVAEVIQELDRRGILHSVASKNNPEEAVAVLKRFGLDDYFLYPQISWEPKSAGLQRIARSLNIGLDTLLLVDDSEFERSEAQHGCPEVRVLDAAEYLSLSARSECDVPATPEAAARRKMYRQAAVREATAEAFGGDYMAFLRDCRIRLHVRELSPINLERAHELTQRTNQMNFSGNRYTRVVLEEIMRTEYLGTYVLDCRDQFGAYGTIGFCIVDCREPRITDMMFSCRIQGKRVEHAFLAHLLKELNGTTGRDCYVSYRRTVRNAPSAKVFDDFGMDPVDERDGVTSLVFRRDRKIPDDHLIEIIDEREVRP